LAALKHGTLLWMAGRVAEAPAPIGEAITLLKESGTLEAQPILAGAYGALAQVLLAAGQPGEALEAAQQSLAEWHPEVRDDNVTTMSSYAQTWTVFAQCLLDLSRIEEAVRAAETGIAARQRVDDLYSGSFSDEFAGEMQILSQMYVGAGMLIEAISAQRKAIALRRARGGNLSSALGTDYTNYAYALLRAAMSSGRSETRLREAKAAAEQAVQILQPYAVHDPLAHNSFLADAYGQLAVISDALADRATAQAAARQAIDLYESVPRSSSRDARNVESLRRLEAANS
jgi:hypothetical protein